MKKRLVGKILTSVLLSVNTLALPVLQAIPPKKLTVTPSTTQQKSIIFLTIGLFDGEVDVLRSLAEAEDKKAQFELGDMKLRNKVYWAC